MNILSAFFLCLISLVLLPVAEALEFDVQVEKAKWSYEEYAKDVTGFSLQLPSLAEAEGLLLQARVSSNRDEDVFFALSYAMMDSDAPAEEVWGITQTNDLSIKQQEIRLDVQYRMLGARFGVWLAEKKQSQYREKFYLNKVLTAVANEPVPEIISSSWAGLSLTSIGGNVGQFETRIEVAEPIQVRVTNPFFTKPFTKKEGLRAGVYFRWTLPQQAVGVTGLNFTLSHEYQELGGEKQATGGFWPYNTWRMTSLGMLYAW